MPKLKFSPVRQRIVDTANDLFYRQGYHQTGINQIIEVSRVAKATFYSHFGSKEDLCVEYLRESANQSMAVIKEMVNSISDPYDKYMAIIKSLIDFMKDTDFRGCAFSNIASEIVDKNNPIRKEVKFHEDMFLSVIRDVVLNLKESNKKYKEIDTEHVSRSYYVIAEGALTASRNYNAIWPMDYAIKAIEDLVK